MFGQDEVPFTVERPDIVESTSSEELGRLAVKYCNKPCPLLPADTVLGGLKKKKFPMPNFLFMTKKTLEHVIGFKVNGSYMVTGYHIDPKPHMLFDGSPIFCFWSRNVSLQYTAQQEKRSKDCPDGGFIVDCKMAVLRSDVPVRKTMFSCRLTAEQVLGRYMLSLQHRILLIKRVMNGRFEVRSISPDSDLQIATICEADGEIVTFYPILPQTEEKGMDLKETPDKFIKHYAGVNVRPSVFQTFDIAAIWALFSRPVRFNRVRARVDCNGSRLGQLELLRKFRPDDISRQAVWLSRYQPCYDDVLVRVEDLPSFGARARVMGQSVPFVHFSYASIHDLFRNERKDWIADCFPKAWSVAQCFERMLQSLENLTDAFHS